MSKPKMRSMRMVGAVGVAAAVVASSAIFALPTFANGAEDNTLTPSVGAHVGTTKATLEDLKYNPSTGELTGKVSVVKRGTVTLPDVCTFNQNGKVKFTISGGQAKEFTCKLERKLDSYVFRHKVGRPEGTKELIFNPFKKDGAVNVFDVAYGYEGRIDAKVDGSCALTDGKGTGHETYECTGDSATVQAKLSMIAKPQFKVEVDMRENVDKDNYEGKIAVKTPADLNCEIAKIESEKMHLSCTASKSITGKQTLTLVAYDTYEKNIDVEIPAGEIGYYRIDKGVVHKLKDQNDTAEREVSKLKDGPSVTTTFNLFATEELQKKNVALETASVTVKFKDETKPEDAKPEDAKPEDTKPEDTKPEDTKPEDTKPEDAKPEDTKPEDAKPEDTKPEDAKPEDAKPEDTKPEDTKPEDTKPEDTKPEDKKDPSGNGESSPDQDGNDGTNQGVDGKGPDNQDGKDKEGNNLDGKDKQPSATNQGTVADNANGAAAQDATKQQAATATAQTALAKTGVDNSAAIAAGGLTALIAGVLLVRRQRKANR